MPLSWRPVRRIRPEDARRVLPGDTPGVCEHNDLRNHERTRGNEPHPTHVDTDGDHERRGSENGNGGNESRGGTDHCPPQRRHDEGDR
jgi:hypothetical protein